MLYLSYTIMVIVICHTFYIYNTFVIYVISTNKCPTIDYITAN